jgi:hypothetical protein
MQTPADYRRYADECERIARDAPQHRAVLIEIAKAWRACAEEAQGQSEPKSQTDGKSATP